MLSKSQQAEAHLAHARELREQGRTYRQIRRALGLTPSQAGRIKKVLKREKAAATRLRQSRPDATPRDLGVNASELTPALRRLLVSAGYRTLGDLADRLADPERPALKTIPGVGPTRAMQIHRMLARHGLLAETDDLRSSVEKLFPELRA